jgi:hypothetical protein
MKRMNPQHAVSGHPIHPGPSPDSGRRKWARVVALIVSALALSERTGQGQNILIPPVEISDPTPSVETASTNWIGSANPPLLSRPEGVRKYPLQAGPIEFHPHLSYQVIYGDGILRGTNNPSTIWLHTVSPGVYVQLGRHWDFDFTAAINHYANADANDNTGLYFGLRGLIPLQDWVWRFGYQGAFTEQPVIEIGGQLVQNYHRVTASGTYDINSRFSFEVNVSPEVRLTDFSKPSAGQAAISDYYNFSTMEWLNYRVTRRTTVGAGLGGGYNVSTPGVDWLFEQLKARAVWIPGNKLSFQFNAGVHFQEFLGGGTSTEVTPIFQGVVVYKVLDPTTLLLTASREVENAFVQNTFAEVNTVGLALRQRLLQQVHLTVQPSYNFRKYLGSSGGSTLAGREDEYLSIYGALSSRLLQRLDLTAFYQYSDNSSTGRGFGFHTSQAGLRVDYRY